MPVTASTRPRRLPLRFGAALCRSLLSAALAPTMGPLERAKYTNPLRNATRSK